MFTRFRVRNFQSLVDVDLPLAPFTVIVGASNSGKSAVLRALRTITLNTSKQGFVTHGAKASVLQLTTDDGTEVVLERGRSLSTYRIIDESGKEDVYAKSGTTVPEDIEKVLRLASVGDESLNFASQFDKPFLLDEPPTKVAQTLGDLTYINILFAAVKEANRRRLETGRKLALRQSDLADVEQKLEGYVGVKEEAALVISLKGQLDALEDDARSLTELESLLANLIHAAKEVASFEVPDDGVEELTQAVADIERDAVESNLLRTQLQLIVSAASEVQSYGEYVDEVPGLESQYHEMLEAAGVCPLCGKTTTEVPA